ncbi:class F sortase [Streptomyces liangshanensis]|uniref:class F sortase n=1 Tax=Streptomyces liangshanensis TaxID=2717324 RepID=UPI0036D9EFA1
MSTQVKGQAWLLVIAAFAGVWLIRTGSEPATPPAPPPSEAFAAGPGPYQKSPRTEGTRREPNRSSPGPQRTAPPLAPSAPVRLRVPAIGVDAPLTDLGLRADGSLEVPPASHANLAGWYREGPPPGARGTAIVAGHVDNARGPAVFYALGSLRKGHRIEVTRRDGRTAVFTVDAVEVHRNEDFPDRKVYGAAAGAELRLITCGGGYTEGTGYRGNVVAYAHLTGTR